MRHLFATNLLINQPELRWNLWRGSYSAYTFNWKKLLQSNETTQDYHVLVSPHISMRLPLTTLNQHGGKLSVLSDIQTTLLFKWHIKTWLWGQLFFRLFKSVTYEVLCELSIGNEHLWSAGSIRFLRQMELVTTAEETYEGIQLYCSTCSRWGEPKFIISILFHFCFTKFKLKLSASIRL